MSFTDAGREIIEGAAAGLYEAGQIVMAQSQVLVPVDTGTLKRSGHVEMPALADDGDSVEVTVGYGYGEALRMDEDGDSPEPAAAYARYVHEIERYHHAPPTRDHFLSIPAEAMEPELAGILEHNILIKLGG